MVFSSMLVAHEQLGQNQRQAYLLCAMKLVEYVAEISKIMLDDSVAHHAFCHWRARRVPLAHANACDDLLHYHWLKSVHNTSLWFRSGQQLEQQVVPCMDFPSMNRST